MTTDEVKAAAERLANYHIVNDGDHDDCDDSIRIASAYLARLSADEQQAKEDAEPITEEWLRSMGWAQWDDRDDVYSGEWYCKIGEWLGWETRLTFHLGSIEAVRMCKACEADGLSAECVTLLGNPCSKSNRPTRGQLRKLLEALKGGA